MTLLVMAMWWCTLGIVHSPSLKGRYRSLCNWIYPPVSASVDYQTLGDHLFRFLLIPIAAAPTTPSTSDPQTDPPPPDMKSLLTSVIVGRLKCVSALILSLSLIPPISLP